MGPTAQGSSSNFPARNQAKTEQNGGRRVMLQWKAVARESPTAHNVADPKSPKSPTPSEGKGAALIPKMRISRGRGPDRPNRSGTITWVRSTSVPPSPFQHIYPTRSRSSEPSMTESTISQCHATDSAIQINKIFNSYPEAKRTQSIQDLECIRDLMLTKPHQDRENIEEYHGDLCKQHLQKVREHTSYKSWKYKDETPLLWIYTHTGGTTDTRIMDFDTGNQKRIVAAAVAEELEQSPVVPNSALAYMFCRDSKGSEPKLNDTAAILRGLLWLLSLKQESLTVRLQETYKLQGKKMYTDEHAERTLRDILLGWLEDTDVGRVYLVVGAIDECYLERRRILALIIRCCKTLPKVKWLITSDCDDIYSSYTTYIKNKLDPHGLSFETIHLNEKRGKRRGGRRTKSKTEREQWKKALGDDTEGTNRVMVYGEEKSTKIGEGYGLETLFNGGAEGNGMEKPGVSDSDEGTNAERPKSLTTAYERTPLLCMLILIFTICLYISIR